MYGPSALGRDARELGQELCPIGDPYAAAIAGCRQRQKATNAKVEALHRTPVADEELQLADGRNMLGL